MMVNDSWMWALAIAFLFSVVGAYLMRERSRRRADVRRLEESRANGFQKPRGQFPFIDASLCIGCGACVSACPEGDVLGLVGGQAVVINGVRCVGIALCQEACPVGAIEVGLGSVKGRADIPLLSEVNETAVGGLFIAGELSGLSLVRVAIEQGRKTIDEVARRCVSRNGFGADTLDAVIVGAGPAGLSAALQAESRSLRYLVLEQEESLGGTIFHYPRRKLVHTQPVELPLHGTLSRGEYSKEELLELFEGLVERHLLCVEFGQRVCGVERAGDGAFEVATQTARYRARFVVLALGRRGTPRKLGVPGEELPKVMYQVRDAELYKGREILCVGGGDSAVEAAMGLSEQRGNRVRLSYRRDRFGRIKMRNQQRIERFIAERRVEPIFGSNLIEIRKDSVLLEREREQIELPNDYVFIFAGGEPPYPLLKTMGVRFGDEL